MSNEIAKVWGVNVTVLALVNVLTLKEWLTCAAIAASLGYTLWKWYSESHKDK